MRLDPGWRKDDRSAFGENQPDGMVEQARALRPRNQHQKSQSRELQGGGNDRRVKSYRYLWVKMIIIISLLVDNHQYACTWNFYCHLESMISFFECDTLFFSLLSAFWFGRWDAVDGGKDDVRPATEGDGTSHQRRTKETRRPQEVHGGPSGNGLLQGQIQLNALSLADPFPFIALISLLLSDSLLARHEHSLHSEYFRKPEL